MYGLGIESSCDETSISIVENGKKLLSLKIFSQIKSHEEFRGVVPEIASRIHLEKINFLLEQALLEANLNLSQISYVAVTNRPGLIGSLMIGANLARCISLCYKIPIVPIDHLEAHLSVVYLEHEEPKFPYLGLLLSGGNTSVFLVHDFGKMELVADTIDDAIGEAYDKVANKLGLDYPGGPSVEKKANQYIPIQNEENPFPEILKDLPKNEMKFSYSGLKTSVLYYQKKFPNEIEKICYFFQKTAFQLVEKILYRAIKKTKQKKIIASGGVLANQTLRNQLDEFSKKNGVNIIYPEKKILCTDNGAMVATLGYYLFQRNDIAEIDFKVSPSR
jgi:N6-L-threonylcarbamoyladenine synthase